MATTYDPIATQTLGSASASVTFSSIPSTYTDLIIVSNAGSTVTTNDYIRFNGDTGANYSWTRIYGTGSAAGSSRGTNTNEGFIGDVTTTLATEILQIQNYTNTTTYKTVIARSSNSSSAVTASVSTWRNTAAITSITLLPGSTTWIAGSTFTLYGIKAA